MNVADLIVIVILAVVVFLAVRSILRRRKNGSCCSGACASCMQKCSTAEKGAGIRREDFFAKLPVRKDYDCSEQFLAGSARHPSGESVAKTELL